MCVSLDAQISTILNIQVTRRRTFPSKIHKKKNLPTWIVCFVPCAVLTGMTLGGPFANTTCPCDTFSGDLMTCCSCCTVMAEDSGLDPTMSCVWTLFFPPTCAMLSFWLPNFFWASSCCCIWRCLSWLGLFVFRVGVIVLPCVASVTPVTGIVTVWVPEIGNWRLLKKIQVIGKWICTVPHF